MAGNSFGTLFRLTTYGESHGPSIGGIIEGVPAGIALTEADIQKDLDLRKPGGGDTQSPRKEADRIRVQSGLFQGHTTGTALAFLIENTNQHSNDYDELARVFRPSHADWSYHQKYHGFRDYRGGGRASGRETAARVAAGAVAGLILQQHGIRVFAASIALGGIWIAPKDRDCAGSLGRKYFAASSDVIPLWDQCVHDARQQHETLGGVVQIEAKGVPAGLGEPVFDKLSATLAHALMSVGAVKGVEIGEGFGAADLCGSANNDSLLPPTQDSGVRFASNHAGGIVGGISTGQDIVVRCAVKPIASIPKPQQTIDIDGNPCTITIGGRHDLSAIPRIVPVLKAMTQIALCDALLVHEHVQNSL
ncbi:MAG: chorismate synthase [Desulfovibrio sp.]|nr:chorismate synthase [Desulfovibrio sp.]